MKKLFFAALAATVLTACQQSLEEKAAQEAQLYTKKNCPAKIADNLRMDSLTFEAGTHTLHYYYTLLGASDSVGLLDDEIARDALLGELKNTTKMMVYKEAGYDFAYTYHSEKNPNVVLFETVYKKKDYDK